MSLRALRYEIAYSSHGLVLERMGANGRPVRKLSGYQYRGRWAPVPQCKRVCKDKAGRWRGEHAWDLDDVCIFCDQERVGTMRPRRVR
jgi:hypothetical protein